MGNIVFVRDLGVFQRKSAVTLFRGLVRAGHQNFKQKFDMKIFMHSHPLMGADQAKFQTKIRRKKIFFVLLVPLTIRLL